MPSPAPPVTPPPPHSSAQSRDRHRSSYADIGIAGRTGLPTLDRRKAELLLQVLTEREERASVAIATNERFSGWPNFTLHRPPALRGGRRGTSSPSTGTSSKPALTSYRLAHTRK